MPEATNFLRGLLRLTMPSTWLSGLCNNVRSPGIFGAAFFLALATDFAARLGCSKEPEPKKELKLPQLQNSCCKAKPKP